MEELRAVARSLREDIDLDLAALAGRVEVVAGELAHIAIIPPPVVVVPIVVPHIAIPPPVVMPKCKGKGKGIGAHGPYYQFFNPRQPSTPRVRVRLLLLVFVATPPRR